MAKKTNWGVFLWTQCIIYNQKISLREDFKKKRVKLVTSGKKVGWVGTQKTYF